MESDAGQQRLPVHRSRNSRPGHKARYRAKMKYSNNERLDKLERMINSLTKGNRKSSNRRQAQSSRSPSPSISSGTCSSANNRPNRSSYHDDRPTAGRSRSVFKRKTYSSSESDSSVPRKASVHNRYSPERVRQYRLPSRLSRSPTLGAGNRVDDRSRPADPSGSRLSRSPVLPKNLVDDRKRPRTSRSRSNSGLSRSPTPMVANLVDDQIRDAEPMELNEVHEDVLIIDNDVILSDDCLKILGENPEQSKESSFKLHEAIVPRWKHLLTNGLAKEKLDAITNRYEYPSNLSLLAPPQVNQEIKTLLSKTELATDTRLEEKQMLEGKALCMLGSAVNVILKNQPPIPKETKEQLLTALTDCGQILTHLFHDESLIRRNKIKPFLNPSIRNRLDENPVSELLFGTNLSDQVRAAKTADNIGKDLKINYMSQMRPTSFSTNRQIGGRASQKPFQPTENFRRPARQSRQTRPWRGRQSSNNSYARGSRKQQQNRPFTKRR
ncbi:Hypothetical protein NTJ_08923 [Nesidiocoris tenuis]|uniref:Uncharacterized protein n=2 Tax=Nesidiocoris tenuis TaxID=355587 RepID=A0ABN7B052_9HEMI|nr:Hypothetical protein NTJ_08923 [Nesidiocoris tenuis]